jgi:hypothetical protein
MNQKNVEKASERSSNANLKKLLKGKNIELERFKRELRIEAALEKVRSRTMRMLRTDDLREAVAELFQQLKRLGFDTHACAIVLYDKKDDSVTHWVSGFSKKIYPRSYKHPFFNHPYFLDQIDAWEKGNPNKVFTFKGKLKKSYDDLIFTLGDLKNFPEDAKKEITSLEKIILSDAFMKYGMIEVLGNEPLPEEKLNILKRFASVFEQTYTRFLDLQKAEAQAREAQIEAALERVRTRTMAMHRSDEIADIVGKIFEELGYLDIILTRVLIWIFNKKEKYVDWWSAKAELNNTAESYRLDFNQNPVFVTYLNAWKNKLPLFKYTLSGDLKISWEDYIFNNTGLAKMPLEVQKGMKGEGTIYTMSAISSYGLMMAGSREPLSDENTDIIQRFGRVFQQSYTRYLDVQKAEAQAREAQIEASLERVRAKAMAMHISEELGEAAVLFYGELKSLGITQFLNCGYVEVDEDKQCQYGWSTMPDGSLMEGYYLPLVGDPVLQDRYDGWKRKEQVFCQKVEGEDIKNHIDYVSPYLGSKEVEELSRTQFPDPTFFYNGNFSHGYLSIIANAPLSKDQEKILARFTIAFEMTYKRFLDLKKAEAQAREAEIQLALERVRARTMAMHRSEELREVVSVLYEQMTPLGLASLGCELILCDEENEQLQYWSAVPEQARLPECYPIPKIIHPFFQKVWKAWKKGTPRLVVTLKGQEKRKFDKLIFEKTAFKNFPENAKNAIRDGKVDVFSLVTMKYGLLEAADVIPLLEHKFLILERFANVFEQTYTRFLDLQKAEAQAREAKVEAALERVRARTMAMHRSDELREVVYEFFEQLHPLGFAKWGFQLRIAREDEDGFNIWISTPAERILPEQYHIPTLDHWVLQKYWDTYKKQIDQVTIEVKGEDKLKLDLLLFEKSDVKKFSRKVKKSILDYDYVQFSVASMRYGLLEAIDVEPIPQEEFEVLKRFAKVFEQTYTRFLDLQKAEAQAREAQIEVALERVRARTMAMHKSNELADAASVLFKQLRGLGGNLWSTGFVLIDNQNREDECWMSNPEGEIWPPIFIPNTKDTAHKNMYDHWVKGVDYYSLEEGGKILEDHYSYLMSLPKAGQVFHDLINAGIAMPTWQQYHAAYFKHGYLLIITLENYEDSELLIRFAKVFDQTYTRFLDLKKAEEQVREAQIEASLERVRARSMAMHNSEELLDVAHQLYKELEILGVPQYMTGFVQVDKTDQKQKVWVTAPNGNRTDPFFLPLKGDSVLKTRYNSWEKQDPVFCQRVSGKALKNHLSYVSKHYDSAEAVEIGNQFPDTIIFYCGNFSEGYLHILSEVKWDKEQEFILQKFTKVFSITYRRFLDLKLAEKQTREAQIEASLERIRAKAMAMHSSEDISEATTIVFSELEQLGIRTMRCGIGIMDDNWGMEAWTAASTEKKEEVIKIIGQFVMTKHPALLGVYEAWKNQQDYFSYNLSGKDAQKYYDYVNKRDHYLIPKSKSLLEKHTLNVFNFPEGGLFAFTQEPLDKDSISILQKFTSVFSLTYRRFLDLKKAEEQAREAKIEAALERVRARSMAMHSSEELSEVAYVLFEELKELGVQLRWCWFGIFDEDLKGIKAWYTDTDGQFNPTPINQKIKDFKDVRSVFKAWKDDAPICLYEIKGPALVAYVNELGKNPVFRKGPTYRTFKKNISGCLYQTCATFKQGYIGYSSFKPRKNETLEFIGRFAKSFEQTYTRFLDLQKVEAQAREAQIEAALERVRSKSIGMQKSEELKEVIRIIFDQLALLDINAEHAGIVVDYKAKQDWNFWIAETQDIPSRVTIPYLDSLWDRQYVEAKEKGKDFFATQFNFEEKNRFYQELLKYIPGLTKKARNFYLNCPGLAISTVIQDNIGLYIENFSGTPYSDDENNILMRFGKVFQQTYTRFLDLQKAEEQAREAQIEAGLERVRASTMAMHKSEQLSETAMVLFDQFYQLGQVPN